MRICSVLLYRCYLNVYSQFLLIVDVHSVVCFVPVCGEVGRKPCASCILTQAVWVFTNCMDNRQSNVQNVPCEPQTCHMIIDSWYDYLKTMVTALFLLHLDFLRLRHYGIVVEAQTASNVLPWHKILSAWFLISAHEAQAQTLTSLSTHGEVHHAKPSQYQKRLFAINVHCKKVLYLYILRLSLFTPVLNFPSRFLNLFKICNMLDWPSLAGFLCFIIYNLVGLWVYI